MSAPLAVDNLGATALVFGPLVGSVLAEGRRFRGDARRRYTDRTYWQLQAWQLGGLVGAVLVAKGVPGAAMPGSQWLWVVVGSAVGLMGVTVRWWAIRTLGKQFTRNLQVTDDHEFVVQGPYRHVRHPSYTGAILTRGRRLRTRECVSPRGVSRTSRDRLPAAHPSRGGASEPGAR